MCRKYRPQLPPPGQLQLPLLPSETTYEDELVHLSLFHLYIISSACPGYCWDSFIRIHDPSNPNISVCHFFIPSHPSQVNTKALQAKASGVQCGSLTAGNSHQSSREDGSDECKHAKKSRGRGAFLQVGHKPWDEQAIETVIFSCFGGVLKKHRNKVKTFQLHQDLDCALETCPEERNYEDALSQPVAQLHLGSGLQQDLRGGKLTP